MTFTDFGKIAESKNQIIKFIHVATGTVEPDLFTSNLSSSGVNSKGASNLSKSSKHDAEYYNSISNSSSLKIQSSVSSSVK